MKVSLPTIGVMTLAAVLAACASNTVGQRGAKPGDRVEVVIMGTTDVHGRLVPWDYYTGQPEERGLAKVATLVDSIRAANERVALIDSGDLLQGNPLDYYFGVVQPAEVHPVVHAMNYLQYDASTVGNHEFNYGLEALDRALDDAGFPFVVANVFVAGTDTTRWPPYTVINVGGVLVGVLGFTTPGSTIWDRRHVEGELEFRDIVDSAVRVWPELEAASDVQIVAIHSGMGPGSSYDAEATGVPEENAGQRLAETLPGIDAIFLGHSHVDIPSETVNGVLLTQAAKWGEALAVATLTLEREEHGWRLVDNVATTLSTEGVPSSAGFMAELAPYHEATVAYVADTIGWTAESWSTARARQIDTPAIDLIQRVQLEATGADLSAASAFTTEAQIEVGAITVADAAGLYIYDNTLKAIEITGAQLRAYLEYSARFFHRVDAKGANVDAEGDFDVFVDSIPGYNYDMVAGVDYTIDLLQPVGSRIRDLTFEGEPVTDDQTFTLAINNYRQSGGGGFSMLQGAPVVYDRQEEIRQLLIEWIGARDTLRHEDVFEPSWRLVPEAAAGMDVTIPAKRERERIEGDVRSRVIPLRRLLDALPPPTPIDSDTLRLVVLATNDFHGALEPMTPGWAEGDTIGGAEVLAGFTRAVEARYPGVVLHLDGGDVMQGTVISNLTAGRSTVDVMNEIGLDAAAIGNHEFDWGVETLRARMSEATFPWLSANIFVRETGMRPDWVEPYAWFERAGLKIAVIGASTVETPETTMPQNVADYEFRDIADVVNELAPDLKAQGADLIIVAVHAGAFGDDEDAYSGEVVDAAHRITAPVDLIVSGHTHSLVETVENGIPIVQAWSSGTALGVVTLSYVRDLEQVVDHTIDVWTTRHSVGARPYGEVTDLVTDYRAEVAEIADAPIARLVDTLERVRGEESALGDLIADAQRAATGDQIAIVNGGGIRTDLPAGSIAFKDVFAVQPFENVLMRLELTGAQLERALEAVVEDKIGQVSGIRFRFDPSRPAGDRVVDATLEEGEVAVIRDGRTVEPERIYTVTANNFMVSGGSGYDALGEAMRVINTGLVDSEVMVAHLAQLPQPIRYSVQGRIEQLAPWPEGTSE
jgi:2',3'-cyclic-nucleotide 2'-phosphodiesterase/3'-nucleotidase/5'-nucleotidase